MKTRIIAAMFTMALLLVSAPTSAGYNAPEVNDMTMHKFPQARSLAEVVGQDRYQMAALSERVDGIIRRGVVTRVRPTGDGFEFTFPEGVESVYLVDVEIYNPGARPVTLRGIESAIPVRPGQGVRVLIPGGDVTRGPIVMGRLTPAEQEVLFVRDSGHYPVIGWPSRAWVADVQVFGLTVETNWAPPPNSPELFFPEVITWATNVTVRIETADGGEALTQLPFQAVLHMMVVDASVVYTGVVDFQQIIVIDEVGDLGGSDLTRETPVDSRPMAVGLSPGGDLFQAQFRGNQALENAANAYRTETHDAINITMTELGVGTK